MAWSSIEDERAKSAISAQERESQQAQQTLPPKNTCRGGTSHGHQYQT